MQEHCSNVLKHDTPGIISCGLCFGANQHTKITDLQNRSSRRWFLDGPRCQTKSLAASSSALIACETSCAFSSSKKMLRCNRMKTQWNASFLKKRSFTSHPQNKSRTTIFVKWISPLQNNFCENTFGHVLGNEAVHMIRFHHIFEFLFFIQFIDFRTRSR